MLDGHKLFQPSTGILLAQTAIGAGTLDRAVYCLDRLIDCGLKLTTVIACVRGHAFDELGSQATRVAVRHRHQPLLCVVEDEPPAEAPGAMVRPR